MRRTYMVMGGVCLLSVALFGALSLCKGTAPADAGRDWLAEFDGIAKEFSGEIVSEGGKIQLEGPRRMAYYQPKVSAINPVSAGALYALHIGGNPEAIIAIENSVNAEARDKTGTYIEITRLSGAAVTVYRKGEKVAAFPGALKVEGAYVGLVK